MHQYQSCCGPFEKIMKSVKQVETTGDLIPVFILVNLKII